MLSILGTGVSKGISIGTAHVLRRSSLDVPDYLLDTELIEDTGDDKVDHVRAD